MKTQREILFDILSGKDSSQIGKWLLFPYAPTAYYVDVRNHSEYKKIHEVSLSNAIILNRRNMAVVPNFTDEVKTTSVDGRTTVVYKDMSFYQEITMQPDGSRKVKKLLTTEEDIINYSKLPVLKDKDVIYNYMDKQLDKYLAEKHDFPEEYGSMMLDIGEPILHLYHISELQEFSIWSLTANEYVETYLENTMERYRHIYTYCLEKDLADVYFMVGSELASPPLVSRKTFQEWIVPYAQELIALVHSYDKFVIQHYHGQIKEILPDFLTMNPDALHTIESPPIGDCTLEEAFKVVGDNIALIGNIQYDEFRSLTPEQMTTRVKEIKERCKGKRFILSPTAGPFDQEPHENIINNYLAFINA